MISTPRSKLKSKKVLAQVARKEPIYYSLLPDTMDVALPMTVIYSLTVATPRSISGGFTARGFCTGFPGDLFNPVQPFTQYAQNFLALMTIYSKGKVITCTAKTSVAMDYEPVLTERNPLRLMTTVCAPTDVQSILFLPQGQAANVISFFPETKVTTIQIMLPTTSFSHVIDIQSHIDSAPDLGIFAFETSRGPGGVPQVGSVDPPLAFLTFPAYVVCLDNAFSFLEDADKTFTCTTELVYHVRLSSRYCTSPLNDF